MAGVMAWWALLADLRAFLAALTGDGESLEGVSVVAGQPATPPPYPNILVLRDRDSDMVLYEGGASGGPKGDLSLFLECYIREDDPDPAVGYAALAALEGAMLDAVLDWAEQARERTGFDVTVSVDEILGDADAFRPACGSRTIFQIEWSKFGI